jgi:hypothetical protein
MSEQDDLRDLLQSWPYDAENNLRIVRGRDGREVLQVRLPLGVEQLEMEGRPDGLRPHGKESALEYHVERMAQAKAEGKLSKFELSAEECAELFNEGTLYYFRYLHCFQLKRWPVTVRDTARNLKLFDFVKRYAAREEDQECLEKWRPYVVRMNAVARAMIELENQDYARAIAIVTEAAKTIEALPELDEETFKFERKRSLLALQELAVQIEKTRPLSEIERLEKELKKAIAKQEFERAAGLRDRLRALRKIEEVR